MNNFIYIVTSPPRSGTTSICEMANILGMKSMHVLDRSLDDAIKEGYNFFADTPFYCPEFLIGILQFYKKIKFIYIDRKPEEIIKSFKKRGIDEYFLEYSFELKDKMYLHDALCYQEIHNIPNFLINHKQYISDISEIYKIDMLSYQFQDGWENFCNFVGSKTVPNIDIPYLNRSI